MDPQFTWTIFTTPVTLDVAPAGGWRFGSMQLSAVTSPSEEKNDTA